MSVDFKLTHADAFPPNQHTLFTGLQSSFQNVVAANICFDQILDNAVMIQLVESDGAHQTARGYLNSWALALHHPVERIRFRTVCAAPYRDDREILRAIGDNLAASDHGRPLLVYRDLAQFTKLLLPGDIWFSVAREIAETLNCPVITAGAYGHHPAQRFDLLHDYRPARVLEVKANTGLGATVEDLKTERKWTATGKEQAGVLLFDVERAEKKEIANV